MKKIAGYFVINLTLTKLSSWKITSFGLKIERRNTKQCFRSIEMENDREEIPRNLAGEDTIEITLPRE